MFIWQIGYFLNGLLTRMYLILNMIAQICTAGNIFSKRRTLKHINIEKLDKLIHLVGVRIELEHRYCNFILKKKNLIQIYSIVPLHVAKLISEFYE